MLGTTAVFMRKWTDEAVLHDGNPVVNIEWYLNEDTDELEATALVREVRNGFVDFARYVFVEGFADLSGLPGHEAALLLFKEERYA